MNGNIALIGKNIHSSTIHKGGCNRVYEGLKPSNCKQIASKKVLFLPFVVNFPFLHFRRTKKER